MGFGIWGLGSVTWNSGFGIQDLGLRIWHLDSSWPTDPFDQLGVAQLSKIFLKLFVPTEQVGFSILWDVSDL